MEGETQEQNPEFHRICIFIWFVFPLMFGLSLDWHVHLVVRHEHGNTMVGWCYLLVGCQFCQRL